MSVPESTFYITGGTLRHDAPSYVERKADRELLDGLLKGEFCYVLTSRQMGKSSLMVRTAGKLREQGVAVIVLDLTAIGQNLTPEQWYHGLLVRAGRQVELEDMLDQFWDANPKLSPVQRFFSGVRDVVLTQRKSPLVIFVDEIDTVRSLPFSTDEFFAAIRECYNRRTEDPEFSRLTFCLLGVATPGDLIRDARVTPFNVGRRIELNDFTVEEAAPLATGLRITGTRPSTLDPRHLLARILHWTNGHPYLTQRLCQAVAHDGLDPDEACTELFFSTRARERDDNLIFVRERLLNADVDRAGLLHLYAQVLARKRILDDETDPMVGVLRLSGVVRSKNGALEGRNRIYERAFDRQWIRTSMPDAEVRREKEAFRRGVLRTTAVATVMIAIVGTLGLYALRSAKEQARERIRAEQALRKMQIEKAEQLFASGRAANGLASLAWVLRTDRNNRPVAERIISALGQRNFCLPLFTLNHDGPVTSAHYSRDGTRIVTGSLDKTSRIWDSRSGELLHVLNHEAEVLSTRFSADGESIVTGSSNGLARIWNAQTGQPVSPSLEHGGAVFYAEFSLDGQRLVTASADGTARVWEAKSGLPLCNPLRHANAITSAKFSSDGQLVVTATHFEMVRELNLAARVWDWQTGELVSVLSHRNAVNSAEFSFDGKRVITASVENNASVWDARTGRRLNPADAMYHRLGVVYAEFSPDATALVTASGDNSGQIWNAEDGKRIGQPLKHDGAVRHADFSANGQMVLTASDDGTARVWDVRTGEPLTEPMRHTSRVLSAHFSPDGRQLVTRSHGKTIYVWDLRVQQPVSEPLRHDSKVPSARFSPDGKQVATASWDGSVRVWDATTGRPVTGHLLHPNLVNALSFSPDGQRLITASRVGLQLGRAHVWKIATGELVTDLPRHEDQLQRVHFSPDGRTILTGSWDGTARIWDAFTGTPITEWLRHRGRVRDARFSPDGQRVVTASEDGTAQSWNAQTGRSLLQFNHDGPLRSAQFSPDGRRIVTASVDMTARIWDAKTGKLLAAPIKHPEEVNAAEFSPKGLKIATRAGNTARLWNTHTGQSVAESMQHEGRINSARFSPDGLRIVTASDDQTARIWDTETGQPTSERLAHGAAILYVEFSPDGQWIVTTTDDPDATARVWEMPLAPVPSPEWLSELAEAAAGLRLKNGHELEMIGPQELLELRRRCADRDGADFYTTWVKWFFANSAHRTISPSSPITIPGYVKTRVQENGLEGLVAAVHLAATNGVALARLAVLALTTNESLQDLQVVAQSDWQTRHALRLSPDEPEVWELRTEFSERTGNSVESLQATMALATELKAGTAAYWYAKGLLLERSNQLDEAIQAYTKAIDGGDPNKHSKSIPATALLSRARLYNRLNRSAEAAADRASALQIRARRPDAPATLVDLSSYFNASLDENWGWPHWDKRQPGHNLAQLPHGQNMFEGTEFDVRGIVQLGDRAEEGSCLRYPQQVTGIEIGQVCQRLHILHGCHGGGDEGQEIGSYRIRFQNKSEHLFPIRYGQHLRRWNFGHFGEVLAVKPVPAWHGTNGAGYRVCLYKTTLTNPQPTLRIQSIDFIHKTNSPAPFLVGITIDP